MSERIRIEPPKTKDREIMARLRTKARENRTLHLMPGESKPTILPTNRSGRKKPKQLSERDPELATGGPEPGRRREGSQDAEHGLRGPELGS